MKNRLIATTCVVLLGMSSLFATSLRLKNDTKNVMMAEVLSADGTPIGEETIPPFETELWSYEESMRGKPMLKKSITPLTVVWKTEKGDFFSACSQVSSGAMVTPLQCRANQ